jgi:hypothetical protein
MAFADMARLSGFTFFAGIGQTQDTGQGGIQGAAARSGLAGFL